MNKPLLWGAGVFIVGVILLAIFQPAPSQNTPQTSEEDFSHLLEITDTDWTKGPEDAKVTLVEYSDFQCPTCKNYHTEVKKLLEEFPEDLRFAYRHLPLSSIHANAVPAAQAAEAAGKQGKFWEMHDMLFEKQSEWEEDSDAKNLFVGYAGELGLDTTIFENDYNDSSIKSRINDQRSQANEMTLSGTPTFFINGQRLAELPNYDTFKSFIEVARDQVDNVDTIEINPEDIMVEEVTPAVEVETTDEQQ